MSDPHYDAPTQPLHSNLCFTSTPQSAKTQPSFPHHLTSPPCRRPPQRPSRATSAKFISRVPTQAVQQDDIPVTASPSLPSPAAAAAQRRDNSAAAADPTGVLPTVGLYHASASLSDLPPPPPPFWTCSLFLDDRLCFVGRREVVRPGSDLLTTELEIPSIPDRWNRLAS